MSLRGATDLVATWQSRGSANRLTAIRLVFYVPTFYCHFAIKSFDLEGWAVGVAVTAISTILQTNRRAPTKVTDKTSKLLILHAQGNRYTTKPKIY